MESSARKKILFVITKSVWGGAGKYVYDLATHLPQEEFKVAVALGGAGPLKDKLEVLGVTTIPLSRVQRDLSFTGDVGGFSSLYQTLRAYRPEIVHLNSSKAGGLGSLAARLVGVPRIIFTAHGWPFLEKRNILWRLFAYLGSWATALLAHEVIVVSQSELRVGTRLPFCKHKMHLIYNGIDLSSPFGTGGIIRDNFPEGAHIVGTIGELTHNKNQISLIEEAKHDANKYVAIVGEGEDRSLLGAKIKEYGLESRVKLFGFIPVHEVLKGFDVFALPSLKEGLPYVLLEARAAGLPIVANRVGGVSEILDAKDMSEFSLEHMLRKTIAVYNS